MKKILFLSALLILPLVQGCHTRGTRLLKLHSGAYLVNDGSSLQNCSQYLSFGKGDALYWVDPDGADTGMDPFTVSCDMENGGEAVFESLSDPAFPYTNLTDTTVTFFSDEEVAQINALRSVAQDIQVESDLTITFTSDTSSGGCGAAPVISAGEMSALTLPLTAGVDTTETLREFSGSADQVIIEFDNSVNQFTVTSQSPAGCTDAIVDRFGAGEAVWIKQLTLKTIVATRADSKASGTYYRVLVK